ncbi:methyltransferase type 11 [Xylaria nigripes]|nr:methyltransferase type 11 [Xylaria nigripes]
MDLRDYNRAVFATYTPRTAEVNSAYMLPIIKPNMRILDVGCGPGSITLGLASRVPEGSVTGIDIHADAVNYASEMCKQRGVTNASFSVGDALKLPFDDNSFDIVHAHQVLVHLPGAEDEPGPVRGLKEMRRVCKPGGFVCTRDVDWPTVRVYPQIKGLRESVALVGMFANHYGKTMEGGRGREFARRAGFRPEDITASASAVTCANSTDRAWWGEVFASRLELSSNPEKGAKLGFVTEEIAGCMVNAWREWVENQDGFYCMLDGEIVCKK